jgi:hypothetical protein
VASRPSGRLPESRHIRGLNDANLRSGDVYTDENVRSAEAWLPKSGIRGSQRRARENGSAQETDSPSAVEPIDEGVLEWVPGGSGPSSRKGHRPVAPDKPRASLNASPEGRPSRPPSSSDSSIGPHAGDCQELAQLQRIEIQVLARRVEELESELSASRRDQA